MASDTMDIPKDPSTRRQLWRDWIASDAPQAEAPPAEMTGPRRPSMVEDDWVRRMVSIGPSATDALMDEISASLVGKHLPASDRKRLIARATEMGLQPFEANLMIAAAQHRAPAGNAGLFSSSARSSGNGMSVWKWVSLAVLFQTLLLLAMLNFSQ